MTGDHGHKAGAGLSGSRPGKPNASHDRMCAPTRIRIVETSGALADQAHTRKPALAATHAFDPETTSDISYEPITGWAESEIHHG